ncbi:MAG: UvrD-helicase domain-containing protein [Candidatus Paceibacterota bacterium]
MDYLAGLNNDQRKAVLTTEGPLLVLAGAGSGKTKTITHRIVHLIHKGVAPQNILAVTFTNKAAREMRERTLNLVRKFPPSNRAALDSTPVVTTFHSFGVRLLREFHEAAGLRRHFTIYDRSDSKKAVKAGLEIVGYNPKEFEPGKILSIISKAKGDAFSRSEFADAASSYPEKVAVAVWEHYEKSLQTEHALDFDDLLLKTLNLVKSNLDVREILQKRFPYIHIDEYQDTNKVQYEIARLLAGKQQNLCVVGDIDQSIYSWRGADIKNVLQFETHFPNAKTILLEENYRSTKNIIDVSNKVIAKNRNRIEKNVFTNNEEGEKITLFAAFGGGEEADYIARNANALIEKGISPSDIAVLFRTNFQSRALEEAFINYEVPYQVLGVKFFERKEVKDVLSYLRLALNPGSNADLARIINSPVRGIGKVTVLKILEGRREEIAGATLQRVEAFDQMMTDIADEARTKKLSETLKFIITRTGIETNLKKGGTEEDLERLENLRELVSLATRYDELDPEEGVEALLEDAALQSDQDEIKEKEEKDAVRLMTVHASKGLEFPYVFISGLEEGLFPHERLDDRGVDHEEERRLFYVAITRAGKKLWLTYANSRMVFGSTRTNLPSSFLSDISEELVEIEGRVRGDSTTPRSGGLLDDWDDDFLTIHI